MSTFTTQRDRDAWNTIRGYVYQVDLTVERWLNLQPGQTLELECGEDIDIVSRSLTGTLEEQQRLLEQVKHRDSSITLKTPEVVTAIACFVEHCLTNPDANLLFRFTTNTQVGREKLSPMPKKIKGITAWEEIRQGNLQSSSIGEVLNGIRAILKNVQQPDKLHSDTWRIFRDFITTASDEQILNLISNFEWSTQAPEAQSLSLKLQQLLTEQQRATDNLQAQEQYQRLFLYVFKLLSKRGSKQLTVDNLTYQLSLPTLSESDRQLLNNLSCWIQAIESRVVTLEQGLSQTNQAIILVNTEVKRLAREQGIDASIRYTLATPILNVPPSVTHLSNRTEIVNNLTNSLSNYTWVAIHGSAGTGKTQLAILIVSVSRFTAAWLRLRGLTDEQACVRLDNAWDAIMASPFQMLVLDDIPRLSSGSELAERLLLIANTCLHNNIHLLSTSSYELPLSLRESLDGQTLYTTEIPRFNSSEVFEMFQAYGAPDTLLTPKEVDYINALVNGHPLLLAAIARDLRYRQWRFTDEEFARLLKGAYTGEINDETISRLLESIEDSQGRELLYRLNLVVGNFSFSQLQAVAAIYPTVERPRERLNALLGLWVQRDADEGFLISPLIKALGSSDLSPLTRKDCHLALGELTISKSELSQSDITNAVIYFLAGEAFDRAGVILILAFSQIYEMDAPLGDSSLLSLWYGLPLHEQMTLGIRICLRAFQISVRHKFNKPISYLLEDLDTLIEQASEKEAWAVIAVAAIVNPVISEFEPIRTNNYLLTAFQLLPNAQKPDGSKLVLPSEVQWEWLLWSNVRGIATPGHLRDWLGIVEQLTPKQRQSAFTAAPAETGCLLISNIWFREASKPKEQQQWQEILAAFRELANKALQLNLEFLWACAIRTTIIILAEYCNEFHTAVLVAEGAIAQASNDPRIMFLIKECVGRQYVYINRNDEALVWLNNALNQSTPQSYPLIRMHALLSASRAIGSTEPYLAIQYAQQAVNLAQSFEEIPEIELVKALGELAIARWLATGLSAAFDSWNQAGERLFTCRASTEFWKPVFVVYAHISGYFTTLATTGSPPTQTLDGQPYPAPQRGIFLNYYSGVAANYNASSDSLLPAQLAKFAEAIGDDQRAAAWALKGIDMARTANQYLAFASLATNVIPHLLRDNRYAEILDLAVEAGVAVVAIVLHGQSGGNTLDTNLNMEEILGSRPNQMWRQAESNAFIIGLLPIIFHLCNVAIRQPDLARRLAADIAALCREISEMFDEQTLWITAALMMEEIHLQQSSCRELISRYQNFNLLSNELQVIWYLAATLQEGTTLADILVVHFTVMPRVYKLLKPRSTIYRSIVLPFINTYWKTAFEQVRFRFHSPQLVGQMLFQAQNLSEEQQAQFILITVAYGLDIRLDISSSSPEINQWLTEQFPESPI